MNDQKIENLLNLALEIPEQERMKSESLEVGFEPETQSWEVIVKYSGELEGTVPETWQVVTLSGGYAIVTLPQEDVDRLAALPQIEYVEKPKRMYFSVDAGRRSSCISALQQNSADAGNSMESSGMREGQSMERLSLYGQGILVAVIDSGVDYTLPDFRNADGTTRILAMWDQTGELSGNRNRSPELSRNRNQSSELFLNRTIPANRNNVIENQTESVTEETANQVGRIPDGFVSGVEYTKAEIDRALAAGSRAAALAIVPEQDLSGHGTQVLGIAAGNGSASGGQYRGVAPESDLIIVKLGLPHEQGFPRTTELMQAVEYVYRKAGELGMPMAVNISFGNAYGSHRGTSLLETYLDMMAARGRSVIVTGTGNEGNAGGHASGRLRVDTGLSRQSEYTENRIGRTGGLGDAGNMTSSAEQRNNQPRETDSAGEIELLIGEFETTVNLQIWKNYADEFVIWVTAPDGQRIVLNGTRGITCDRYTARYQLMNTDLLVYYGEPSPYQSQQEIYLDFIPQGSFPYIDSGIWTIQLLPQRIVTGEYDLWLNDARARNPLTRFLQSSPDTTMTIPSAASGVIAVGAYDARQNAYASFSGRGWPDETYQVRPDLVAPGVNITTTAAGGGYVSVTGTSFAAPFVTGSAALLMEWGIVKGNDPYLYGEKVRAYLHKGARQLPGFERWPNEQAGYGRLCLQSSLPY